MLKACKWCGRVHDSKFDCGKRPKPKRQAVTKTDRFRSSQAWTEKSIEIRTRDRFLCQICIRKLYGTVNQYNCKNLSVHHAVPIAEDWERRLDNNNLITSCAMHHEMMEDGTIPREEVQRIIEEQEDSRVPPGYLSELYEKCPDVQHAPWRQ